MNIQQMIGIIGGTFDPIHIGHLRIALDVKEQLGLDEVRFIPLNQAVHREQPQASPEQRLAMVRAAVADQDGFVVDERELKREGASYTVDTLASLRQELADTPLCLLLGSDAFNGFLDWHRPQEILQLAHLVVMGRPGEDDSDDPALHALLEKHRAIDRQQLHKQAAGLIYFQSVTQLEISATRIRQAAARGESIAFLVPPQVEAIIRQTGCYQSAC